MPPADNSRASQASGAPRAPLDFLDSGKWVELGPGVQVLARREDRTRRRRARRDRECGVSCSTQTSAEFDVRRTWPIKHDANGTADETKCCRRFRLTPLVENFAMDAMHACGRVPKSRPDTMAADRDRTLRRRSRRALRRPHRIGWRRPQATGRRKRSGEALDVASRPPRQKVWLAESSGSYRRPDEGKREPDARESSRCRTDATKRGTGTSTTRRRPSSSRSRTAMRRRGSDTRRSRH